MALGRAGHDVVYNKRGKSKYASSKAGMKKVHKVMKEFKEDELHSGSKKGPKVKSRKQAIAIALNSARRMKRR